MSDDMKTERPDEPPAVVPVPAWPPRTTVNTALGNVMAAALYYIRKKNIAARNNGGVRPPL